MVAVDNGSTDGTPETIRKHWPEVRLIETGQNLGFAAGNNVAIREAIDGGADYVYLLNHDTEVHPDFLLESVNAMESDSRIGAVQSLLLLHPETELVNSTGNAVHFLGFGYCRDYRRPVKQVDTERIAETTYASGAAVLYRSSALQEVGILDGKLFMYHEDLDLGWRLRLAGYRSVLAPKSVVWHKYEFSRSIKKWYFMERNRYIVLFKNLRLWSLLVLSPSLVATEVLMSLFAFRGGWWKKKLAALLYFFDPNSWAHILRERNRIQSIRTIGDREAMKNFTHEIRDQEGGNMFVMFVANPLMGMAWKVSKFFIR